MEIHKKCLLSLVVLCCLVNNNGVEASHKVSTHQAASFPALKKVHRTAYHFRPRRHWINDPNGPMYYNGIYHLFYQYNPKGAVWGNIVWAHSVSKDLINWKRLQKAIYPSKPFDRYGCWSGSATILPGNKPVILYTGIIDENNTQVQNHAIPANLSDPYLRKWVKPDNNPLIVADKSVNKTAFRDPTTAWLGKDGKWRILIGGRNGETGIAHLYKSRDFVHWVKGRNPLHAVGKTGNFECPDFFPVSVDGENGLDTSDNGPRVKHVLKVSLDETRYEYYTIGTYLQGKDVYVPDRGMVDGWKGLRYDYGNFYASKSFFDPKKNRRILWGWANESDSTDDDITKGWAGIQLIPRTIVLDPNGKQLLQWPVKELETLRGKKVKLSKVKLVNGQKIEIKGIKAAHVHKIFSVGYTNKKETYLACCEAESSITSTMVSYALQADVEATFSFKSLAKAEPFDPKWDRYDAQKICSQKGSTVKGGLGPFGFLTLASKHLEEYTPVFFRVFKDKNKHRVLMCSDASKSSLADAEGDYRPSFAGFIDVDLNDRKLSLRSLIDHSVVESFGAKGKTCISSRVYPTLAIYKKAHLYAFNNGSEVITIDILNAWSMRRPHLKNH